MKKLFPIILLWMAQGVVAPVANAQCQFVSPTVELISITTDTLGNCVVTFNLGFEIDINNGNKFIFVHLWRTQDYTLHDYSNQNQPKENDVLGDAVATIVLDNDIINSNPVAPANQVFMTFYGPDPGIDDNVLPATYQVRDATDGLTYNRVTINAADEIYRYTINNLVITLPGACINQIDFTGDAWSSNSNSSNPPVQCSMPGFSFLVNDPTITSTFVCNPLGTSNQYSYTISNSNPEQLDFNVDVYVDNGDNFFDAGLDAKIVADAGPFTSTSGSPYSSGLLNYASPYSTTLPEKMEDLWVVVKNMSITNTAAIPPTTTTISNALIEHIINTCNAIVLPVRLISFEGIRQDDKVVLAWKIMQTNDIERYVIQRIAKSGQWEDVAFMAPLASENKVMQYSATDYSPSTEKMFYRLKVMYNSGITDYSQQAVVPGLHATDCAIGPNPSIDGTISLKLDLQDKQAFIRIQDLQGRTLRYLTIASGGIYRFVCLSAGTYIVTVSDINAASIFRGKATVMRR